MKEIVLTKGYVALVDDDDYERVNDFKWTALVTGQNIKRVYAYRREGWNQERRVWKRQVLMHRLITDAPSGMDVDHINSNTLDNRRGNLRVCTRSDNMASARRYTCIHGYRGIGRHSENSFFAYLTVRKQKIVKSGFRTAIEAAVARDELAREHHGEFARLNFPDAVQQEK